MSEESSDSRRASESRVEPELTGSTGTGSTGTGSTGTGSTGTGSTGTGSTGTGSTGNEPDSASRARALLTWLHQLARRGAVVLLVIVAFALGWLFSSALGSGDAAPGRAGAGAHAGHAGHGGDEGGAAKKEQIWTCSMHPQIRKNKPGQCPICGMDLVPVKGSGSEGGAHPRELKLSPRARELAEIETTRVQRKQAAAKVRVSGKVAFDERRVGYITAWVPGRIDKLYVSFTGEKVRRWQPMVHLYSPELVTAQMELLQADRMAEQLGATGVAGADQTAKATLQAAREKLRLLGLSPKQVRKIEKRGTPQDHLTIYAPVGGVVIEKKAQEQMYVEAGTRLFTIADLNKVWVKLDVYESDLGRVKEGQKVTFTTRAYPGETFQGKVDFIEPFLDDQTRTAKVRLTVKNPDGRLKPDMFVTAVLESPVGPEGEALAQSETRRAPLVIPGSAPLITGKRAVVYVEVKPGTYRGREVVLGPRVGELYVVREGLEEGERVVTQGAFKIDSALQIQARPSMMSPEGGGAAPGHAHGGHGGHGAHGGHGGHGAHGAHGAHGGHGETSGQATAAASRSKKGELPPVERLKVPKTFRLQLAAVTKTYYSLHHALSRDDLARAKIAAATVATAVRTVQGGLLDAEAREHWRRLAKALEDAAAKVKGTSELAVARRHFAPLSDALIEAIRRFGLEGQTPAIRFRCTMAFDNQGADWLQKAEGVENPYYGSQMFRCGDNEGELAPGGGRM